MSALDDAVFPDEKAIAELAESRRWCDTLQALADVTAADLQVAQQRHAQEYDAWRESLESAGERITELETAIALNRYVVPPFELTDDATVQLALECAAKDQRIAALEAALETITMLGGPTTAGRARKIARNALAAHALSQMREEDQA